MKRKICVVVTARASYAKLKTVIYHLDQHKDIELQIVCAGSAVLDRFGNVAKVIEEDGFNINEKIHFLIEGEDLLTNTKSSGLALVEFAGVFNRLKPDIVTVMADRYEVLMAAVAASYQNIPLAHIQGGEVSGNIDEKVRHAITKLADYHFPASERAKEWICRMGEQSDVVFMTGCPSMDLAKEVLKSPEVNFDIYERYGGVGEHPALDNGYIMVMQHAVTTESGMAASQIQETLEAVYQFNMPTLWFWPNPDAGSDDVSKAIRAFREKHNLENIHFLKNMEPLDFLTVLNSSNGIIGNSSVAIREASFLGVPAINIGTRQMNRERGSNVVDTSYKKQDILNAIETHFCGKKSQSYTYGLGNAGKAIAEILAKVELLSTKEISYLS